MKIEKIKLWLQWQNWGFIVSNGISSNINIYNLLLILIKIRKRQNKSVII